MAVKYTFSLPTAAGQFVKVVVASSGASLQYRRDSLVASDDGTGRMIIRQKYGTGVVVAEGELGEYLPTAASLATLISDYNNNYFTTSTTTTVDAGGTTDANNSTVAVLGGSATFTGAWTDISDYPSITINGGADVMGTLFADFSDDEATGLETYRPVQLSTGKTSSFGVHTLSEVAQYFRIRVVNGAAAQSSMTVTTRLHKTPLIAIPTSRAGQTANNFSPVLNVRQMSDTLLDEASSRQSDRSVVGKFGKNPAVAASINEDIWYGGGSYTGWLLAAESVRIAAGGDAADTSGGLGAQKIMIQGLDENWNVVEEEVATLGALASLATTTTFIRVNRAFVTDCGTYTDTNTADIVIEGSGTSSILASIEAGIGQTQLCLYTIPAGKIGYIRSAGATVDGSKAADILYWQRQNADDSTGPTYTAKRLWHEFPQLTGPGFEPFLAYKGPFPEKTDIWVSAIGPSGGASIGATFDVVLETK